MKKKQIIKYHWFPQPKQELALLEDCDELLYGGARGGGKTDTGIIWMIEPRYLQEPRYRGLVIRRNADDLKDWVDRAEYLYRAVRGVKVGTPTEFHFPTGAKIRTGHLNDADAYTKYQGHQYQKMLIEELTHIPREDYYEKLLGSCRSNVEGLKARVFATTNPDGVGFKWVKQRWNIPDYPKEKVITEQKGMRLVFIPAWLKDNPALIKTDPNYQIRLEAIKDDELRMAWLEGYWGGVSIKGAFYFNQINQLKRQNRFREVPYDAMLATHTVWDLGVGQNLAIGFYQRYEDQIRMIDFWQGSENDGITQAIKMLENKPYLFGKHFAPHDIRATDISTGKTRLELAQSLGLDFEVVPKLDVKDGIEQGKLLFGRLFVDKNNCSEWLELVSQYHQEFDEKRGDWTGKPYHDFSSHAGDVHRYCALVWEQFTNDFKEKSEAQKYRHLYNQEKVKVSRFL